MLNMMWFKSDLRILDNPALHASMLNGSTLAVYFVSEKQWQKHALSPAKMSLIIQQLRSLERELASLNVSLIVQITECFKSLPTDLMDLAELHSVGRIYCNQEYELNEHQCERQVENLAKQSELFFNSYNDVCLSEPGSIKNQQGQSYKVFTAFKRAFFKDSFRLLRPLSSRNNPQKATDVVSDIVVLNEIETRVGFNQIDHTGLWPAGENEAHARLERFGDECIADYGRDRDIPSIDGTSTLSPYLAIGALSTRQCLQLAMQQNSGNLEASNRGASIWINELLWREFYRHLMFGSPKLCRFKPFKADTDRLPWRHDLIMFEAWKNGCTGYPIVDAAMRQLKQTAWMHNRLRMVTAMFLTKHLFIDWRWGEAYFMSQLVDGDFASNNGGWQWSASTGVDAVPYFRIFNPTRQSQRFDPTGSFIRRYMPELASLDNKSIHQPSQSQALAAGYCLPIVDHRQATDQTKYYFKHLKDASVVTAENINHQTHVSKALHVQKQQEFTLK
ncbi:MAG: deoxyribodipyrimidine photo-lyase [Pseudohongiellaceae bacterium]|jgi:deoxyribodipyrimidine photo-lyase